MLRHHQQLIRSLALTGMATAALIAPHAASAMPVSDPQHVVQTKQVQDLRSPDAATPVVIPQVKQDLRSPDAVTPFVRPTVKVDLRSPDTQLPVHPTAPKVGAPVAQPTGDGFDWGSAAAGAGVALLLALVAVGSMIAINRKRSLTLGH